MWLIPHESTSNGRCNTLFGQANACPNTNNPFNSNSFGQNQSVVVGLNNFRPTNTQFSDSVFGSSAFAASNQTQRLHSPDLTSQQSCHSNSEPQFKKPRLLESSSLTGNNQGYFLNNQIHVQRFDSLVDGYFDSTYYDETDSQVIYNRLENNSSKKVQKVHNNIVTILYYH